MQLTRVTSTLCPTCYREVPATIRVQRHGVYMEKHCPNHQSPLGLVEADPVFYTWATGLGCKSIYSGYFIDVTRRCNLRCNYCYYALEQKDPEGIYTVDSLLTEAAVNRHLAPFILSGGEPTLHPEIKTVISSMSSIGPVELLTNGMKLAEPEVFSSIMPLITDSKGNSSLNLSIHPETNKWRTVVERCKADGIKIESALIVVDSEESFIKAIQLARELSPTVLSFRIKAASKVWAEQKPELHIFVSDMLQWLDEMGLEYRFVFERQNKSVFVNIICDGMLLMLVSWHDISNVDLQDINCPPFYRARNGEVCNFITSALINEGMAKGWCKGVRL